MTQDITPLELQKVLCAAQKKRVTAETTGDTKLADLPGGLQTWRSIRTLIRRKNRRIEYQIGVDQCLMRQLQTSFQRTRRRIVTLLPMFLGNGG